jgi:hypothetical protein
VSKQAFKRFRRALGLPVNRDPPPAFAWPGGYPIFYVFRDGGVVCPKCVAKEIELIDHANKEKQPPRHASHGGWAVDACEVNWEEPDMHCDHCGRRIPSAYAEPEEKR